MAAVAHLCEVQNVGSSSDANPFHDRVQFNPEKAPTNSLVGGFRITAITLREIIHQHYYFAAREHAYAPFVDCRAGRSCRTGFDPKRYDGQFG